MCTFAANFAFDKATNGQTDIFKTRNVVNTYFNVTFEDRFSNAPTQEKDNGTYVIRVRHTNRDVNHIVTLFNFKPGRINLFTTGELIKK